MNNELGIIRFQLEAQDAGPLTVWPGAVLRAFSQTVLQLHDEDVSSVALSRDGLRPYALGPLLESDSHRIPQTMREGEVYTFTLRTLTAGLTQTSRESVSSLAGEIVVLGDFRFLVKEVEVQTDVGKNYVDLFNYGLHAAVDRSRRRIDLRFASPTTFKLTNGLVYPLPKPDLVFRGLFDRWAAFSSVALHPDLLVFVENCVSIDAVHHVNTRMVKSSSKGMPHIVGFMGMVKLYLNSSDSFWLSQVHSLAAFSQFAGVGARTTYGLGTCLPKLITTEGEENL